MAERTGKPEERAAAPRPRRPAVREVQVTELPGDGGTGANTGYGNEGGNQGMVIRRREDRS